MAIGEMPSWQYREQHPSTRAHMFRKEAATAGSGERDTPRDPRTGEHLYAQRCGACHQGNYSYAATRCGRCGRDDQMHVIEWAGLDPRFDVYYASGERIRVRLFGDDGEELTGTVGRTTGWKPAYLLMLRSNSMGSPWILDKNATVIAVKRGRQYVAVPEIPFR